MSSTLVWDWYRLTRPVNAGREEMFRLDVSTIRAKKGKDSGQAGDLKCGLQARG